MTTDKAARPFRRTKVCFLVLAAIMAFPITIMILIAACSDGRR